MKEYKNKIKNILFFILITIIYIITLKILNISCPIKYITGLSCPGCGMTRAVISALQFKFTDAFYYHPLWIIMPPIAIILIILYIKDNKKIFNILIITLALLFIIIYTYRLFFTDSQIVSFNFNALLK